MKVQELLVSIRRKDFNMEKELQIKTYLPMEVKKTIAQGIIYECTIEEDGATRLDSVERYMSYVKYMITMHTNLDYNEAEDYDKLCSTTYGETTLLNAIMNCFEADAKECSRILNLMCDDIIYANSIEFTLGKFLNSLNGTLGELVGKIEDKVVDINTNIDTTKLESFLSLVGK